MNIFDCRKCGECCKGYGGTFVTDKDMKAIAEYIHTDPATFRKDYCVLSGNKPVLVQGKNGYCIFWDKLCTIHPVKPRMCRAWPFIESVLTDVTNWRIMAASCPGIRTEVSDETVIASVTEELSKLQGIQNY